MLNFKIADQEWEFEQIHKLNYETFVEEIPQHAPNGDRFLVDKFHKENEYIICVKDNGVAGMIAVRDKRPFSLDGKLEKIEELLPDHSSVCELRLLSIKKNERSKKIIRGLFVYLAEYCENKRYDLALISATTNQERLYRTLGFKPFGPLVGSEGAMFQPMFLTPGSYFRFKNGTKILNGKSGHNIREEKIVLQPGPVKLKKEVSDEFRKEPISHRSGEFELLIEKTKGQLCRLTGASYVQILMGSGTLCNDHVAAQLSKLNGRGLILSNGEFGERLEDHAKRIELNFDTFITSWGSSFDYAKIKEELANQSYEWLWFVHCETSTGILNDLEYLVKLCGEKEIKLCADCISSLGCINTDLSGVYLATGASGKGLASYPGLSFVFHNSDIKQSRNLPRYLDTGIYSNSDGVPYTLSSNLLSALYKSLQLLNVEKNKEFASSCSEVVRERINNIGPEVINPKTYSSPAVVTIKLPEGKNSFLIGEELAKRNVFLSYRSEYLRNKNLIQFVLMGDYQYGDINESLNEFENVYRSR